MGKTHGDAYKHLPNVELAGIADTNRQIGTEFSKKYSCRYYADPEALLKERDIDIIDVCLPSFLHEQYVVAAASMGKHILCEKPFGLSMSSVENMVRAVESSGVLFMVAQVIRFWPEYMRIKSLYDERVLGNITVLYANRLSQHPDWSDWFKDVQKSGGALFDLHLHDIDFVCYLLGEVTSVFATGKKSSNGGWNHVVSWLNFANGSKAVVEGSNVMTHGYPFTMSLRAVGEKATVEFSFCAGFNLEDRSSAKNMLVLYREGSEPEVLRCEQKDAYFNEIEYFVECVATKRKPEIITPRESMKVIRLIHALRESLEKGEIIRL